MGLRRVAFVVGLCSIAVGVVWATVTPSGNGDPEPCSKRPNRTWVPALHPARGLDWPSLWHGGRAGTRPSITWASASKPVIGRPPHWRYSSECPSGSSWSGWSDVRRSRLEMDRGRFAECERLLRQAARLPGPHVAEARWGLVLLLRMEGRFEEARCWLEDGFDAMTSPVETLQRLYKLDVDPFPIEGVRLHSSAQANSRPKTTESGWVEPTSRSAGASLPRLSVGSERCLERRPDDPVVWRMKLDCGLAAGQAD